MTSKVKNLKASSWRNKSMVLDEMWNDLGKRAIDLCKKGEMSLKLLQQLYPINVLNISNNDTLSESHLEYQKNKNEDVTKRERIIGIVVEEEIEQEKEGRSEVALLTQEIKGKEGSLLKALKTFAATTVPDGLLLKCSGLEEAQVGIFSFKEVEKDAIFGPCVGSIVCDRQDAYDNGYCWDIYINNEFHHCVDARNAKESNWMRYVNPSDSAEFQNLEAFQREYQIYFRAIKDIPAGTELFVWYSLQYNQDCHLKDPDLEHKCRKSLQKVVSTLKKSKTKVCTNKKSKNYVLRTVKKIYKCDVCDKIEPSKATLNRHKLTHTKEKPHKCEMCDRAFMDGTTLRDHLFKHNGEKPFECDICNQTFLRNSSLKHHKLTHTGEKPHRCEICKKDFSLHSNLYRHKRIHTNVKAHSCPSCNKTFLLRQQVKSHMRIHTQEKPYKCDTCQRAFSHTTARNKHQLRHNITTLLMEG